VSETEDHIAGVCEVMRHLIAGEDAGTSNLATQQRFYNAHLRGWIDGFCDLLEAHPRADFYRSVAGFTRDFAVVEAQGLDLLDA
jgi:TorA maturation chaperone TorD